MKTSEVELVVKGNFIIFLKVLNCNLKLKYIHLNVFNFQDKILWVYNRYNEILKGFPISITHKNYPDDVDTAIIENDDIYLLRV